MHILAIDCATSTGCADGPVGGKAKLWTWSLSDAGEGRPERFRLLNSFLSAYFENYPCDAVVYEEAMPISAMKGMTGTNEATQTFLRGAIGVIEMTCAQYGKPVRGIKVQDARQIALGWRTNREQEPTKHRVMREVKMLGFAPEDEHQADAAVLWAAACNRQNPRLATACTPLFRGT